MTMPGEEFQEAVTEFRTAGRTVLVFFTLHAGAYRLAVDRDDFNTQLAAVAASYKLREPVSVLVHGLLIERITGP